MTTQARGEREAYAPQGDVMLYVNKQLMSCDCGCNVFRHVDNDASRYRCNACAATYAGVRIPSPITWNRA